MTRVRQAGGWTQSLRMIVGQENIQDVGMVVVMEQGDCSD